MLFIGRSFHSGPFSLPRRLGPQGVIVHRLFTAGMFRRRTDDHYASFCEVDEQS